MLLCHVNPALPDTVVKGLRDQLFVLRVAAGIWGTTAPPVRAAPAERADALPPRQPVSNDARGFAGSLRQPDGGVNAACEPSG